MMSPHQKAGKGDAQTGESDKFVAENMPMREGGDEFADNGHAGQNHDIYGRVRVEPEEMLEQNRVAAHGRVKNSDTGKSFDYQERQSNTEYGSSQYLNQSSGINPPDK